MTENTDIPDSDSVKRIGNAKKGSEDLSLEDLRRLVKLKYGSESAFARKMGWNRTTAHRLLKGSWIPQRVEVIERIAQETGIMPVLLDRLFAALRGAGGFVTADTLK